MSNITCDRVAYIRTPAYLVPKGDVDPVVQVLRHPVALQGPHVPSDEVFRSRAPEGDL